MTAPSADRSRLLLYLGRDGDPAEAAVLATLARLATDANCRFDAYLQGPRAGTHYGGGDPLHAPRAALLGGTVIAGRHLEAAVSLAARHDVLLVVRGDHVLEAALVSHGARVVSRAVQTDALYRETAAALGARAPEGVAILSTPESEALEGIAFYAAPLAYESGRAVFASGDPAAARWPGGGRPPLGLMGSPTGGAAEDGTAGEVVGAIKPNDDFARATLRLFEARREKARGIVLGDPALVAHWLPWILRQGYAPVYGTPLARVIEPLSEELGRHGRVLGRVFEDDDFFSLARHGACLQVIDPERPPFPAAGEPPRLWPEGSSGSDSHEAGGSGPIPEPDEDALESIARQGGVLVTLAFWAGAIREIETLYALFDLVSTTGMRCGVALTSDSYRLGGGLVSLMAVPREAGGVFPLVEPLLGSAGDGITIESLMPPEALRRRMTASLESIRQSAPAAFVPRGWWCTMDARLESRPARRAPKRIEWRRGTAGSRAAPRVRYHKKRPGGRPDDRDASGGAGRGESRLKSWLKARGAERWFEAYRPFEFLEPGDVPEGVWDAGASAGLEYVLTKSGFGPDPRATVGDGFVAVNHTAGRWDGWTPFETANDAEDLREAERRLLAGGRPGWLLSTVDTCLWAFSGEMWTRGSGLHEMAAFCASGGETGRLIPALPRTVARYAALCRRLELIPDGTRSRRP